MKLEIGAKSVKEFKDLLELTRYLKNHPDEVKEYLENLKPIITHLLKTANEWNGEGVN